MAKKKGNRLLIRLRSSASNHTYQTFKNRRNTPDRMALNKYDPTVRKHVEYKETK